MLRPLHLSFSWETTWEFYLGVEKLQPLFTMHLLHCYHFLCYVHIHTHTERSYTTLITEDWNDAALDVSDVHSLTTLWYCGLPLFKWMSHEWQFSDQSVFCSVFTTPFYIGDKVIPKKVPGTRYSQWRTVRVGVEPYHAEATWLNRTEDLTRSNFKQSVRYL